jgi:uncharacterized Ntn-hydrolase superfamily protein
MSKSMEKIKIKTKEIEEEKIGEETPKTEIAEEETISKQDIEKREAEIKAQDEEELVEQREKIKEIPKRKMTEEERIKILSEKYPGASEVQLKNYLEALAKVVKMNIFDKMRGKEKLFLKEQLALRDWKNQKAALDFLSKSKKTIEVMEGVKEILKEAVEKNKE